MSEKDEIKLFGRWSYEGVEVKDPSLKGYICLRPVFYARTGGRHEHRPFAKANVPIVERLANQLMRPGRNAGLKVKALNIIRNAFEIIHLKTGENPLQVLVRAVENAAPCEDVTRVAYGGIVYHRAVDVSPSRRLDLALRYLVDGARLKAFGNPRTIDECLADEIIKAAEGSQDSYAVQRKDELERIALASR
ncbi:30S ribosomal protein S7 [Candidatus Bathyarchaeota archaeon]|nr:30S ribosomal protein S7 [Candidatus Bathyarchaeota archaeon]